VKRTIGSLAAAALIGVASFGPARLASAQTNAYGTAFSSAITYQNVGAASATIQFGFQNEANGTVINVTRTLAAGAAGSLAVGNLTELASFTGSGSAVVSSDQPIVATVVQLPAAASAVKNRPLYNGFSAADGANSYLIATVLNNKFNSTTKFSVQNVDTSAVNLTVRFYNAESTPPGALVATSTVSNLPVGASKSFDAGAALPGAGSLPAGFNGSATIEATGKVVASALELSTTGTAASAFEGMRGGATKVYMPSAICNMFNGQNTAYAVQNTSTSGTATVTATYSNGATETKQVAAGAKASFLGCGPSSTPFSGSAVLTSTGGNIAAIMKVFGGGMSTATPGATTGASKLALPYVRWSESRYSQTGARQRAFIAIQLVRLTSLPTK